MRRPGWEERLAAEIDAASRRPWAWGSHDCATFAARCVLAMGPHDFAREAFAGQTGPISAARRIKALGGGDLIAALDAHLPRIEINFARRGDVAAIFVNADGEPADAGAPALGIIGPRGLVVARHPNGIGHLPRARACAAWAVE